MKVVKIKKSLDEINSRDLSKFNLISIMIDGIEFGDSLLIVAMGIIESLSKVTLGIKIRKYRECGSV